MTSSIDRVRPACRSLIACVLAPLTACSYITSQGAPEAQTSDGGSSNASTAPPPAAGRYWAHAFAHGTTTDDVTMWFQYKPDLYPDWLLVPSTPEQRIAAGTDLTTVSAWLYGLTPGTGYQYRTCTRTAAGIAGCDPSPTAFTTSASTTLGWVSVDPANPRHLIADGTRFVPWGNNYLDVTGGRPNHQTIEDQMYDARGLARIDADFLRLSEVAPPDGATNAVRVHLQLHTFLIDASTPDPEAFARFSHVIELAEDRGLRVMVTGLNDYYPGDDPPWVGNQTDEAARWATQALWWSQMAYALHASPGVFAYDLMNEPSAAANLIAGRVSWTTVAATDYCSDASLASGVHAPCFTQFITPDLGSRAAADVATAWAQRIAGAVRHAGFLPNDTRHLLTIGAGNTTASLVFLGAPGLRTLLDFLEPHFYPGASTGQDALDLATLLAASTPEPIIAGEVLTFSAMRHVISTACNAGTVGGWFGPYDGRRLGDACLEGEDRFACALYDVWYGVVRDFGPTMRTGGCTPTEPAPPS